MTSTKAISFLPSKKQTLHLNIHHPANYRLKHNCQDKSNTDFSRDRHHYMRPPMSSHLFSFLCESFAFSGCFGFITKVILFVFSNDYELIPRIRIFDFSKTVAVYRVLPHTHTHTLSLSSAHTHTGRGPYKRIHINISTCTEIILPSPFLGQWPQPKPQMKRKRRRTRKAWLR